MCGPVTLGRTERALAGVLSALIAALAFALLAPAPAGAAPTLRVRALESPPDQLEKGERFRVRVRVTRQGTGFRSGVLAYHLTLGPRVGAGSVRLAGRTSLASLRSRRQFERRVRIGVPRSMNEGRYFLTACVVVLRGTDVAGRRPCRASLRRVSILPAATVPVGNTTGNTTGGTTGNTTGNTTGDTTGNTTGDTTGNTTGNGDEPDDPTRIAIFPWVTSGGFEDNWLQGLGFAGLGLIGALVLLFFTLGDFLPRMGGKADYLTLKAELDALVKRRDGQFTLREAYIRGEGETTPARTAASEELTDDLQISIQDKQRLVSHERNRLLTIGMFMYAVLGAAFAVLFAANALQAILIGFGWTAVAERFGLKKEDEERTAARQEVIDDLRTDAQRKIDDADKQRTAAEARANTHAEATVTLSAALAKEAEARKHAQAQLAVARGQEPPPQEPPHEAETPSPAPATPSEPAKRADEPD